MNEPHPSQIRETLQRAAQGLNVPFAVVQADSGTDWTIAQRAPCLDQLVDENRREAEYLFRHAGFSEVMRVAFFYASRVPFPHPDEAQPLREIRLPAEADTGCRVWPEPIYDGLPDPSDARPRLMTFATGVALHDMFAHSVGIDHPSGEHQPLPTFMTSPLQNGLPPSGNECRLVIFSIDPARVWRQLREMLDETGFFPSFLSRCNPSLCETVAGMSYVTRPEGSGCRETKIDDGGVSYKVLPCVLIETPELEWLAIAHGPHLGQAIVNAFDLEQRLPPAEDRVWPAPGPEHPRIWLTRELESEIPPYHEEASEYPKGSDRLNQDRWLYWTWQSGRWTWPEISNAADGKGVHFRPKAGSSPSPDRTRSLKLRATTYAKWIGQELRKGR